MATQFRTREELDAYHTEIRKEQKRSVGTSMITVGVSSMSAMWMVLWMVGAYDIVSENRLALGIAFGTPWTMLLALTVTGAVIKYRNR